MTTADIERRLIAELDDLDVRVSVVALRNPSEPDLPALRRDIAALRARCIDALAMLRQAAPHGAETLH